MKLTTPCLKYAKTWKAGLAKFQQEKLIGFWNFYQEPKDINKYIAECQQIANAENLKPNQQPSLTFWLIANNKFIGHCNIRHQLPLNNTYPGHIGYHIIKSERGKGYGTTILKLAIQQSAKIGLTNLILYTLPNNIASHKVITNNGGKKLQELTHDGKQLIKWEINLKIFLKYQTEPLHSK